MTDASEWDFYYDIISFSKLILYYIPTEKHIKYDFGRKAKTQTIKPKLLSVLKH
jgi:hypothetical protein